MGAGAVISSREVLLQIPLFFVSRTFDFHGG